MGVHGLWRLIEPSGKPVPVETLENKILAVDISIWLHQSIKGYQDSKGAPLINSHLLGIYHRVCKLLYFKIKPIFVFDGGVPALKKQTIAKRNQVKSNNASEADKLQKQLLSTLLKHSAINKVISEKAKQEIKQKPTTSNSGDDLYKLPPLEMDSTISSSSDEEFSTTETDSTPTKNWTMHNIDTQSPHFKNLPADVRHEILTDLKETRKQSSWGRLHELPTQSNDFSTFQMNRLLKRQSVQSALEEAEKEMGGHSLSLGELENILQDQGVISKEEMGQRIASDENTRFLFIKDVKLAMEKARKKLETIEEDTPTASDQEKNSEKRDTENEVFKKPKDVKISTKTKADLEYESDLQKAIAMSLECEPSTSDNNSFETFSDGSDSEFDSTIPVPEKLKSAQAYMTEYSGLTPYEISKIISGNTKEKHPKKPSTKNIDIMPSSGTNDDLVEVSETPANNLSNHDVEKTSEKIDSNLDVLKDKTESPTEIISSSDTDDDFVEITETSPLKKEEFNKVGKLEIKIDANFELKDDLFSDIFGGDSIVNNEIKVPLKISPKYKEDASKNVDDCPKLEAQIQEITPKHNLEKMEMPVIMEIEKHELSSSKISNKVEEPLKLVKEPLEPSKKVEEVSKEVPNEQKTNQNEAIPKVPKLSIDELTELKESLSKEKDDLTAQKSTKERLAANITDQMYQEAQELLELFGVPYVIAPMEAEAQCAFLETASLTHGTITDDSDIWLFGGKTVYKNFFNQTKHVLEFRSEDIQHHFKLTREQMILLALLVGSDYTTGIQGVGPVTAMEILAAFPIGTNITLTNQQLLLGLNEFKTWLTKGKTIAKSKHSLRNKLKNITLAENFPSNDVVQAYLKPEVDPNTDAFSWAKPDVVALTDFARIKFGWTTLKSEEILKPVLKKLEEKIHQSSIRNYFKIKHKLDATEAEKHMSKRVKKAVKKFSKEDGDDTESDTEKPAKTATKTKPKDGKKDQNGDAMKPPRKRGTKPEPDTQNPSTTAAKKPRYRKKPAPKTTDPEIELLAQTEATSSTRKTEIAAEALAKINEVTSTTQSTSNASPIIPKSTLIKRALHAKDRIMQKEMDRTQMQKSKMRAIELFRRSKQGPGYVEKKTKGRKAPKLDAGLSESSSDSE